MSAAVPSFARFVATPFLRRDLPRALGCTRSVGAAAPDFGACNLAWPQKLDSILAASWRKSQPNENPKKRLLN